MTVSRLFGILALLCVISWAPVILSYLGFLHFSFFSVKFPREDLTDVLGEDVTDDLGVTCHFPKLNPFSSIALAHAVRYDDIECRTRFPTLTAYDGKVVRVLPELKRRHMGNTPIQCRYRNVVHDPKTKFSVGGWSNVFRSSIVAEGMPDFVEVKCRNLARRLVSASHHYASSQDKTKSRARPEAKTKGSKDLPLNVLMIGLDAVSSSHYKRTMVKTRHYLNSVLGAVEMNMHNIIGDGSLRNLMALLTGKHKDENKKWSADKFCDETLPLIWSIYKSHGYKTQYVCDWCDLVKFRKPPTDSFLMPMVYAMMSAPEKKKDDLHMINECFDDHVEVALWLKYIKQFVVSAHEKGSPFFSFSFLTRPTHDFMYKTTVLDEYYEKLFKDFHKASILNNTICILFSDHGGRYGAHDYRWTFTGSIEERAPLMVIFVPPWFRRVNSKVYQTLLQNRNKLTTHFDIHSTLKHIVSQDFAFDKDFNSKGQRAVSIFREIDSNRTCADAGIHPHFCLCRKTEVIDDPTFAKLLADAAVVEINSLLVGQTHICHILALNTTQTVVRLVIPKVIVNTYRIVFTTLPGKAAFEATVSFNTKSKTFAVSGTISRVNAYGNQSYCVNKRLLQPFCYCKNPKNDS